MNDDFRIVIPARFSSERLPGKPLRQIHGKPMIEWVYLAATRAEAGEIVVATDDMRIADAVTAFGGNACLTADSHRSGTDRIREVASKLNWSSDSIVVNLQGDEPLMPAANLAQVARNLALNEDCVMATLYREVDAAEAQNPELVKLVHDVRGRALYFSRSAIPFDRGGVQRYCGHVGIYAYRAGFLEDFSKLGQSELERSESLEQLRVLENGYSIHCDLARAVPGPDVNTEADLERVEKLIGTFGA